MNPEVMWKFSQIKKYKYELRSTVLVDIPLA